MTDGLTAKREGEQEELALLRTRLKDHPATPLLQAVEEAVEALQVPHPEVALRLLQATLAQEEER